MIKRKKKAVATLIVVAVIIILIIPIFFNWLLLTPAPLKVDSDADWISFFGSYFGAIIGGIVSGIITLLGVRLTLKNQYRNDFLKTFPGVIKNLDAVVTDALDHYRMLKRCLEDERYRYNLHHILTDFLENKEEFLNKASQINYEFYVDARMFVDVINNWYIDFGSDLSNNEKLKREAHYTSQLYQLSIKLVSQKDNLVAKYDSFTDI